MRMNICDRRLAVPAWIPLTLVSIVLGYASAGARDWPQYRGANHDGISSDRIRQDWSAEPPAEVWRVPCTNGPSSLAVSEGRVYTQIRRYQDGGNKEVCVALDMATGRELWATVIESAAYDGGVGYDDGPRSTPSAGGGRVYVNSSHLVLRCLDAANGSPIWSKDLRSLYGGAVIGWQNAASPVLDGELVYVNCNSGSGALAAFRASDGDPAWRAHAAGLTHSTPVRAVIEGVDQLIFAAQNGLWSVNRADGALLWKAAYPFNYDTSLAGSPVVYSNLVFISAAYSMGGFAVRVGLSNSTWVATPAWTNTAYKAHWMTPVCHEGYLYGMFGSSYTSPLKCIDIRTGAQRWSVNGFGRGGTILVDGRVLALTERGDLVLIEANPAAYTETARINLFPGYDPDANKCWNVPAVCDGRIYARSTAQAVCLDAAIPPLKLITEPGILPGALVLWIGTETGVPLEAGRAAKTSVLWTSGLGGSTATWAPVASQPVLTEGRLRLEVPLGAGAAFYRAAESP